MIITVTPNPSVDRTIFIDELPRGEIVRSRRGQSEPSGKGVNVALALNAHGYDVLAVLPVGGPDGVRMVEMLSLADLPHVLVPIAGQIRSNISLVEPDGTVTKINEAGPVLDDSEIAALTAAALERTRDVTWIAGCGSLPALANVNLYADLAHEGRRRGVRTAIDTSGAALRAALAHRPHLVKPNVEELAEATGRSLVTIGDVVDAAEVVRVRGAEAVLASLGQDGAVLLDANGAVHGEARLAHVVSAVGAGDALLAGFLAAGGSGPGSLRSGLLWAAAAVQHEGTLYSGNGDAVPIEIHADIARDRHLAEPPYRRASKKHIRATQPL